MIRVYHNQVMLYEIHDIELLRGRCKRSDEKLFQEIQAKLPQENMITEILKNHQMFNYVIENSLIEKIFPILPYYLVDYESHKPVLPRICEHYQGEKKCKLSYNEFVLKKTLVLQKNSLSNLLSVKYKCVTHPKSQNDLATHKLELQDDTEPSIMLIKSGGTFCDLDFYNYICSQYLKNQDNNIDEIRREYNFI